MRGYQKRIVCLKRTGSPIIEEAYFVLSDGASLEDGRESFLKEANRIIEENTVDKKKRDGRILPFCLGILTAVSVIFMLIALSRLFA